jgi:hypothetical protein
MKANIILSEEQLIRQAMDILIEKLGVLNATRFLTLKQQNKLDAVTRHQEWQTTLNKDQFFNQVFGEKP